MAGDGKVLKIVGKLSEIRQIHSEICLMIKEDESVEVSDIAEVPKSPLSRERLGVEPLTYFTIVFVAHLGASLAHDAIKGYLAKKETSGEVSLADANKKD